MKRRILFTVTGFMIVASAMAQVGVSPTSGAPDPSAGMDVNFSNKGFLPPRMTADQIQAIASPPEGLMVFNTTSGRHVYFDGTKWRNFDGTSSWSGCGNPIEVLHAAGPVAPVNKTVLYGTVTGVPGEPDKCWITRNLGADQQATSETDSTEPSAGWYWQFNRKQGYQYDGTVRTPGSAWITYISESSDWLPANDPCALELGMGWRIPTETEWDNVAFEGPTWPGYLWNSALKLHYAGCLLWSYYGELVYQSLEGDYWSKTQIDSESGSALSYWDGFPWSTCAYKQWGCSIRCIRSCEMPMEPPSGSAPIQSSGWIQWNWQPSAGASGYKWSAINDYGTATDLGNNTSFIENGLNPATTYTRFVWYWSECGHSDPLMLTGTTTVAWNCGDSLLVHHAAGPVAPISKTVGYATVYNIPGAPAKCWITSNLGADHQAVAVDDATEASAGWYWQFGKKQGYKHDGTTRTPGTAWITSIDTNSNWIASNDPCTIELGSPWRIPTQSEWNNVDASTGGDWTNWNGPWNSGLKLHAAGLLLNSSGSLGLRGTVGRYWSVTQQTNTTGWALLFDSGSSILIADGKAYAYILRCIRE